MHDPGRKVLRMLAGTEEPFQSQSARRRHLINPSLSILLRSNKNQDYSYRIVCFFLSQHYSKHVVPVPKQLCRLAAEWNMLFRLRKQSVILLKYKINFNIIYNVIHYYNIIY